MVLDPRKEFSPTQKEIVKLIPLVEQLVKEETLKTSKEDKNREQHLYLYQFFLKCLCREYRYIEKNLRDMHKEYTGEDLKTKIRGKQSFTDIKIIDMYQRFTRAYRETKDERLKKVLRFLKFKYRLLKAPDPVESIRPGTYKVEVEE